MIDTLSALDTIAVPGEIRRLSYEWSEDHSWKDRVMRPAENTDEDADERRDSTTADDRLARTSEPQYQHPADRRQVLETDTCPGCVFLTS